MRLAEILKLGIVLLLCAACGKNGQTRSAWPAVVVQISDVSPEEREMVLSSITNLNEQLGSAVIDVGVDRGNYAIAIRKVTPSSETINRAGLATFDDRYCEVELNSAIFGNRKVVFEPVLWHELGHCAGLPHDSKPGEVMYHSASPDGIYSSAALNRFFKAFASATKID